MHVVDAQAAVGVGRQSPLTEIIGMTHELRAKAERIAILIGDCADRVLGPVPQNVLDRGIEDQPMGQLEELRRSLSALDGVLDHAMQHGERLSSL